MKPVEIILVGLTNKIKKMKKIQILIAILGFTFFSVQSTFAQTENNKVEEKVFKTTTSDVPQKVKETLKKYSGYKISKAATFIKKSNISVYRFTIQDGNWTYDLLIDEKGKVKGIDMGEGSGS